MVWVLPWWWFGSGCVVGLSWLRVGLVWSVWVGLGLSGGRAGSVLVWGVWSALSWLVFAVSAQGVRLQGWFGFCLCAFGVSVK